MCWLPLRLNFIGVFVCVLRVDCGGAVLCWWGVVFSVGVFVCVFDRVLWGVCVFCWLFCVGFPLACSVRSVCVVCEDHLFGRWPFIRQGRPFIRQGRPFIRQVGSGP